MRNCGNTASINIEKEKCVNKHQPQKIKGNKKRNGRWTSLSGNYAWKVKKKKKFGTKTNRNGPDQKGGVKGEKRTRQGQVHDQNQFSDSEEEKQVGGSGDKKKNESQRGGTKIQGKKNGRIDTCKSPLTKKSPPCRERAKR